MQRRMAYNPKPQPRFLDINALIRERDKLKHLRNNVKSVKSKEELDKKNVKRNSQNYYFIKNKVFHYSFNPSLIPKDQPETSEPNVKRRRVEGEDSDQYADCCQWADDLARLDREQMEVVMVEALSNSYCDDTQLLSDLEVISPIPPEVILEQSTSYLQVIPPVPPAVILEPSTANKYQQVENGYSLDHFWKPPSIPQLVSTSISVEKDDDDQLFQKDQQNPQLVSTSISAEKDDDQKAQQNFQASSGCFDKYKTCFKRRGDLRMKDAINCGVEDVSLDHPRMKNVTTYLSNLNKRDNLQHWNKLREQLQEELQSQRGRVKVTEEESKSQEEPSDFFQTPGEFFNQQTLRNGQLFYEYVKKL